MDAPIGRRIIRRSGFNCGASAVSLWTIGLFAIVTCA